MDFWLILIWRKSPDPQTTAVIKSVDSSVLISSSSESILSGDQIYAINSVVISEPKDISLELLSYAGYSGIINISIIRQGIEDIVDIDVVVNDFLPSAESQSNPVAYLGLELEYKMKPIIGSLVPSGPGCNARWYGNGYIWKRIS